MKTTGVSKGTQPTDGPPWTVCLCRLYEWCSSRAPKAGKLLEVWPGGGALLVLRQGRGKRQKQRAADSWGCPSAYFEGPHVPCVLNSGQYCHRNLIWGWLEPSSNRIPQHYLTLQTEWVKKGSWWPTYSCVLRETTNVISPSKQRKGHLTLLRRQDH